MAVYSAVFTFSEEPCITASLNASTASSAILLGTSRNFAIVASGAFCLTMGGSTMSAATASAFEFPGGAVFTVATSGATDHISIYNPTASSITYWIQPLAL